MIALNIRFLTGRFHGTPWHKAHNEGVPEWPPSPWRILRSLVSAAYAIDADPAEVERLLEKLRAPPRYRLPSAVDGHTRHYVPETKAKLFDAFVAVDGGARDPQPITVAWDAELDSEEVALLARLCARVSYLGRVESWAEMSLVDVASGEWDCWPDETSLASSTTTLLTPSSAEELATWAVGQAPPRKGRDVPRSLWDVLTFEGARFRSEGWSTVPGTRPTRYIFARPPFRRSVVPAARTNSSVRPTVARFAIRSAVLPRAHDALRLGERLRQAAMAHSQAVSGHVRSVFSGHGPQPLNHEHAMYLSTSESPANRDRGFVDHLVIAARGGFDEEDVLALQRLRRLWGRGGHDLDLVLVSLGQSCDFGGTKPPRAPVLASSCVWESVTPFVPTRHPKRVRGEDIDTFEEQMSRACEQLTGVRPTEITPLRTRVDWSRFRRRRDAGGGHRGPDRALGARLVFDRPVVGPIAVGYGAHFGLGLFAAV